MTLTAAMLLGSSVSASETEALKKPGGAQADTVIKYVQEAHSASLLQSEEAMARIRSAAEEYYASTNRKMVSLSQADPESPYRRPEYEEGYAPGETALFEASIENNGFKSYTAVGSKDGWNHCSILYEVILKDPAGEKMDIVKEHVAKAYPELNEAEQAQKAEELYQEKYIGFLTPSKIAARQIAAQADKVFVDTAYENAMARDRYVAELIGAHSGTETTTQNWEYNLEYLKLHYEEIMAMEGVNSLFVDLYIEIFEGQLRYLEYLASGQPAGIRAQSSSYNADAAVAYAKKHAKNPNPEYSNWTGYGGDCANFVSQCLHAGGMEMRGTPGTIEASENLSNWFSTGNSRDIKNKSETWRAAVGFRTYWTANANDTCTFSVVGSDSYNFGWKGDAVSLLQDTGNAFHTLIIVGYDDLNDDFLVAAHSDPALDRPLREYYKPGGFVIYHMK